MTVTLEVELMVVAKMIRKQVGELLVSRHAQMELAVLEVYLLRPLQRGS